MTPQTEQALRDAKAEAYDCLAQIQQWQQRLTELNARIASLLTPPPPEVDDASHDRE